MCHSYWPRQGGLQNAVASLVDELSTNGHEVIVVTRQPGELPAHDTHGGVPVHRVVVARPHLLHDPRFWSRIRAARLEVAELFARFRPDIMHSHFLDAVSVVAASAASQLKIPWLATCHGSDVLRLDAKPVYWTPWVTRLLRNADAATAVAQPVADAMAALGCRTVELVPNGVQRNAPDGTVRSDTAVFCGRLEPVKAPEMFIEAVARAEITGAVLGDGSQRQELEARSASDGTSQSITFFGAVDQPTVISHLRRAACLVISSRSEGMPLVALEAMSVGTPIIATDVGDLRAVCGDAALFVPVDDVASLASTLRRLIRDRPLRERLGAEALRRAALIPSWTEVSRRYEVLYRSLR